MSEDKKIKLVDNLREYNLRKNQLEIEINGLSLEIATLQVRIKRIIDRLEEMKKEDELCQNFQA